MSFVSPDCLWALLPVGILAWSLRPRGLVGALRLLALTAMVVLLAEPQWISERPQQRLALVVDRSASAEGRALRSPIYLDLVNTGKSQ